MRILTKALLGMIPAALFGITAAGAAEHSWKQSCQGPEVACSMAKPVAETTKSKAKLASEQAAPVKKAKKNVAAKKFSKAAAAEQKPMKAKKKIVAKAKPSADGDKPAKKVATKSKGDSGGSAYQAGIASWYGGNFHGRTTANGEKYNMWALTAAHKTLPFGTRVKVTNLNNGDTVIVRINDRGPFVAGRVIDLSKAAANELGMGGLAKVKLTVLSKG